MQKSYDKEADAIAIWFEDAESERTIDIAEDIFIDLDKDGKLAGIEILHASEKLNLADLLGISMMKLPDHSAIVDKLRASFYLYVLTDRNLSRGRSSQEVVEEAIAGGADAIQLRDKGSTAKQLLQEALKLRGITRRRGIPFIINDRVDLALAVDADGVHLGQDDLPIAWARKLLGNDKIIGISTHNLEEAMQAERDGADYVSVGSVFPTTTKPDARPLVNPPLSPFTKGGKGGLGLITDIKRNVNIPVVAIGGIKEENVAQVREAGADCIAVISAVVSATNVKEAAKNLRERFLAARKNWR